ncbi:MAG: rod shape-determining protein RodA [Nitrospira sp. SB0677_bin_15]|nr:rod shape-determining protein RodA [Nitrospira sp. SB0667_bin_9]MYD31056.1 rod shape-determining protein RodA [Nitrospira sp. SB0661_bin_20]MYG41466.1 rod shape-determining protein RodA [Nitrospira sp. SB0677_bin_15]MYH01124.1 rod shape-determining protein RodA [Nitrospira sp. SB0675_bin_23]MYJ22248.1 rod shape-determining protein RodA [Nitrospira sp. SB0673_bin_12]
MMDEPWRRRREFDRFDWYFCAIILALSAIGVLTIYSVTSEKAGTQFPLYLKQVIWIGVGALAFLTMSRIDYHALARWSFPLYGVALVLLVIVLLGGKASHGAQRWIALGPLAFQPAEFVKIPMLLILAVYYSAQNRRGWWYRVIVPALITVPVFSLILKQPDLGSSLSFLSIYVTLLLVVGVKSKAFGVVLLSALMLFPFAWSELWGSLHDYQKERILSFVNPDYDPAGRGYQGMQSRIAVGSGQLVGRGFHGGTQTQFKFLPEGHTDFIFAVLAEEWGFLGGVLFISLFLALLLMGLDVAAKAKDSLGALLAIGLVGMLTFNMAVNVGMTIGLAPIVGIPLPLLSYGGSATIMTMAGLGLLFSVKKARLKLSP